MGTECKGLSLLRCSVMLLGKWFQAVRKIVLPMSFRVILFIFHHRLINFRDPGDRSLWNVMNRLMRGTTSHPPQESNANHHHFENLKSCPRQCISTRQYEVYL